MSAMGRGVLVFVLTVPLLLLGCDRDRGPAQAQTAAQATLAVEEFDPQMAFEQYYRPVSVEVQARIPGYDLPLDLGQIVNADKVQWLLTPPVREMLGRQGFAVLDRGAEEDIKAIYEMADDRGIPPFVTVDTLLHIYHLQFDQTLKSIEEREFFGAMTEFSRAMLADMQARQAALSGDLQEAAKRNVAYFAVGLKCLDPSAQVPGDVADMVSAEIALIDAHAGFSPSPIFGYQEDYSQYVPRGHYTRSEELERYFRALMWYGRIVMLLKGGTPIASEEQARIQTLQAALIAGALHEPANAAQLATWKRVYAVTCFYVGFADDLTPQEYAEAIVTVAGSAFAWSRLAEPETLLALRSELATYRAPQIYGGTGQVALEPPFSPEQLDEVLTDTMGLRLMGQRFIPDGYMMQELGFPQAGAFTGQGTPFSMELTQGGPQRVFPRGLDVMAALGSERAHAILQAEGDTAYANYEAQLAKLRGEFDALGDAEWNRNLYFSWLRALRALIVPVGEGFPSFMRTAAWHDRTLWAALASWAELRHDTILYAKQPYMPIATAMPMPPEAPPTGFVEPRPEFYARMLALARMTRTGLTDLQVLDEEATGRLTALEEIIDRLLQMSLKELRGEALTQEEGDYLKYIAGRLEQTIVGIEDEEDKTTIVADVLTDTNTGQALEEGVGYVKLLLAAYRQPDGRIVLGVGPVLSHYEFKHPIADRLTDEAWRELLGANPPEPAPWTASFYVRGE